MIKLSYLLDRIRDVKPADYLSIFPMTMAMLLRPFFKNKYRGTWLVCEEPAEARDNGYHFFKYMCEKQAQQKCFYAIKRKSVDAKKVQVLGATVEYGSIQHWLAYFLCDYNISSQKGGKPNAAMCAFMELNGRFKPQNVFLQHGITINDVRWLYADLSKFKYFITSTVDETKFIENNFGYPVGTVQMTGMPRFDSLHENITKPNRIVIMPTWRYWFNLKSKQSSETDNNFSNSEYLLKWREVIYSKEINEMIRKYNLEVIFYLHRNMQEYIDEFYEGETQVKIASWKEYDIQELLKSSAMMITDYSSVFFDMIYMKKPVIFYQFDAEKYRKHQYEKGYFDYENNVFGKTVKSYEELIVELLQTVESGMKPSEAFLEAHKEIFPFWDDRNSERVFNLLMNS